ncbi:hypothetical protein FRC03_009352 [Tulasnella sp. 419]|nr:hypothetical protein FRC02_002059 [Tulasnella sp. 418]KAG8958205.1 hypothetical protein FRC03_009352 [Tulasnella sp. 419]
MATASRTSSLAKTIAHLTRKPSPVISSSIRSLQLTLADRNAHMGARHFIKEDLPRVAYANPNLSINVIRKPHPKENPWSAQMTVELDNGQQKIITMSDKMSPAILQELLDLSGETSSSTVQ